MDNTTSTTPVSPGIAPTGGSTGSYAEPTETPGVAVGVAVASGTESARGNLFQETITRSDGSTETEYHEKNIVFFTIACVGIVLFFVVLFQACIRKSRQRKPRGKQPPPPEDPEDATAQEAHASHPAPLRRSLLIVPLLSTILGFSLSIVPHASCDFLYMDDIPFDVSLGLWRARFEYTEYIEHGECQTNFRTDDYDQDASLVVARIFAVLATVLGGLCGLVHMLVAFVIMPATNRRRGVVLKGLLVLTAIVQLVPLCLLNTDYCTWENCRLDYGAASAIMASYFWLLASFALVLLV